MGRAPINNFLLFNRLVFVLGLVCRATHLGYANKKCCDTLGELLEYVPDKLARLDLQREKKNKKPD